jgi:hypothetical protein
MWNKISWLDCSLVTRVKVHHQNRNLLFFVEMLVCARNNSSWSLNHLGERGGVKRGAARKVTCRDRKLSLFVDMIVCTRDKGNPSEGCLGGERGGGSQSLKVFPSIEKRIIWNEMYLCTYLCPFKWKVTCRHKCDGSEQLLEIKFFPSSISVNKIFSWQNFSQSDFFMVEIQPIRWFGYEPLSNQGFQPESSASQMFPVFSSRSIKFFQAWSPADSMLFQLNLYMKYIDTIKITDDSIWSHHAENRPVEGGGPSGCRRSTVSRHLQFTLDNLNRKSKDPVFYEMVVNGIIIILSMRQFTER